MPFNPTKEQEAAIVSKSEKLVVSASAGSGKTTVMIERIVSLIEDGKVDLENILVLTFTNASAADMKEKLYNKLLQKASSSQNCNRAILSLPISDICTIDSFCQKLLKTFFYLAGIDPAFSTISPLEEDLLLEKTVNDIILKELQNSNDKMLYLLNVYFSDRKLDTIKKIILEILKRLSVLADRNNFIEKIASSGYSEDIENNLSAKAFVEYFKENMNLFVHKSVLYMQEFRQAGLSNIYNLIEKFYLLSVKAQEVSILEEAIEFIKSLDEKMIDFDTRKTAGFSGGEKEATKTELTPFFKQVKKFLKNSEEQVGTFDISMLKSLLKQNRELVEYLVNLAIKVEDKFLEQKNSKALMDFAKIEATAVELLNMPEVKNKIKEKYRFIFADEYQDMNELQDNLLSATSIKNNFIVGDAKQSIYEFRLADPQIFIDKVKAICEKTKSENKEETILLNSNFRSREQILSFVNNVFSKIMTEVTSGIDYAKTGAFVLTEQAESQNKNVKIMVLNSKEDSLDDENEINGEDSEDADNETNFSKIYSVIEDSAKKQKESKAQIEATLVYDNIMDLIKSGVSFNKISILIRSKSDTVKDIIKFLRNKDIPLGINFKTNLLEESEVLFLHNFLKVISNRYVDSEFTSLMLSPFFNFSLQQLAQIRAKNASEKFFYNAVLKFQNNIQGKEEDTLSKSILNFLTKLDLYVLLSANLSIKELALKIVQDFNYLQKIDFMIDADKNNVQRYIKKLSSFDDYSLTYFLTLTKNGNMLSDGDDSSVSSNKNEIKINTIHSSKGLEYDYVFLIDAGKKFNDQHTKEPIIISNKFGIGLKSYDKDNNKLIKNITYSAIIKEKAEKLVAEEIRLLYVALTRAKLGLFVFGKIDTANIKPLENERDVFKKNSYLKLIISCLDQSDFERFIFNKNCFSQNANFVLVDEQVIEKKVEQASQVKILPLAKAEDVLKLKNIIDNNKFDNKTQIKLKNSVTGLINEEINIFNMENEAFKIPEITEEESERFKNTTNSQIGIIYHSFLEKFNFNEPDIIKEKERVKSLIGAQDASLLDDDILKRIVCDKALKDILAQGKIYREQKFVLKLNASAFFGAQTNDEILVQGIIDVLIKTKDGFIILDYKATHKSAEEIKQVYRPQLELYKLAGEKILQIKCKNMFVYSLFSGKIISIE